MAKEVAKKCHYSSRPKVMPSGVLLAMMMDRTSLNSALNFQLTKRRQADRQPLFLKLTEQEDLPRQTRKIFVGPLPLFRLERGDR
jgi:hypothetical protein